jgi:hypothetical protein
MQVELAAADAGDRYVSGATTSVQDMVHDTHPISPFAGASHRTELD